MKAAIIPAGGKTPIYADFREPVAQAGQEVISVHASALSHLSKARSSGSHYSSDFLFPAVAGVDGVGLTAGGQRVYFALPEAPFGSLAEKSLVRSERCVSIPDELDDVTAAAIANPGMSAWASLVERAHLRAGEIVLINGATGTAGRVAIQLAKYLGAAKVIATGRNANELEELKALGADVVIQFALDAAHPSGSEEYEQALEAEFSHGIDIVIDYLWGASAHALITAIAKAVEDARPVRFVQVGSAGGEESIELPASALRSSAIQLMGSGLKSVCMRALLNSIVNVFEAMKPANLQIATKVVRLSEIESTWASASGKPRVVFTIP